ncbi:MAG: MFS transporter [Proteobacteria bacterium]|nr:MFS transporter [Pseudomonadota bacterium]
MNTYAGTLDRVAPSPKVTPSAKKIAAITIGNGLEFFDFSIYTFFAAMIGKQFFPGESEIARLLLSLAVFGVGFVMRPLGGIVIGNYADRAGRKPAMTLTLWLMALGSAVFVLAPTQAQIGIAAPVIIIVGRLIQGFAVGGELGASTSMLLEYATDRTRGYYCSWQLFSQALSTLAGSALGLALTATMSTEALESWGWRIPFAIGLLVIPVGAYIRRHLEETGDVAAPGARGPKPPSALSVVLRDYKRELLIGFGLIVGGTTANYLVLHYLTNYAKVVLHMPFSLGLWAAWIAAGMQMLLAPIAGKTADRYGRKPVIVIAFVLLCVLVLPAFMLMDSTRSATGLFTAVFMLVIPLAFSSVSAVVLITELFPKAIRATGLSLVYALGVSIFGGFAQFNATWLIQQTGSNLAPAWYMIACGAVSLIAVMCTRETAGRALG